MRHYAYKHGPHDIDEKHWEKLVKQFTQEEKKEVEPSLIYFENNFDITEVWIQELIAERDTLKEEIKIILGKNKPVAEVVPASYSGTCHSLNFNHEVIDKLPYGTKLFTHPPAHNTNVDELVKASKKYTLEHIKVCVPDYPDATQLKLHIGDQSFNINEWSECKENSEWLANQLSIALNKLC